MKCPKCGAELSEDAKFCSYCGNKIEQTISERSKENNQAFEDSNGTKTEAIDQSKTYKSSNKPRKNGNSRWNKLSRFGKVATIAIIVFTLLCVAAFSLGKVFAGIIAIIQIVLTVVAVLMKKGTIKSPFKWMYVITFAVAVLLLIPYSSIYTADYGNAERFKWSDIVLGDVIPEPKSHFGEIYINSESCLMVNLYKMSQTQYEDYIESCKDKGFTVDQEELTQSYSAFDSSGYELSIYYYESNESMHITVNAPEEYGTITWPDSGMATLLPIPKSISGEIDQDDESWFYAYVGNMSIEDFGEYVSACAEYGFVNEAYETDKYYYAEDSSGYRLEVSYDGNNVISISLREPEYEISIEVECVANLIFSKYDVKVYLDNSVLGTVEHGTTDTFTATLTKGTYELKFENDEDDDVSGKVEVDVTGNKNLKYKISCTSSSINVQVILDEEITSDEEIVSSEDVQEDTAFENEENESSETESIETESSDTESTETEASETESTDVENSNTESAETKESVSYSTNTEDTVKNGNEGVYSYKSRGGTYDIYWIIDFDEGCVYWFTDGNGDSTCDRIQIDSGDLNSVLIITYHDGSDTWSYGLHFKYKSQPDHLIMQETSGAEYDYYTTNLESALALRDERTINDY